MKRAKLREQKKESTNSTPTVQNAENVTNNTIVFAGTSAELTKHIAQALKKNG